VASVSGSAAASPFLDEILSGVGPVGEVEMEAGFKEARGDDASALEHELGFGTH